MFRPYRAYYWYFSLFLQIFARLLLHSITKEGRCRLKNAAEQQNICSQEITQIELSCRAAKY